MPSLTDSFQHLSPAPRTRDPIRRRHFPIVRRWFWLAALVANGLTLPVAAQLLINEVCYDNSMVADENGDTSSDWIELYNAGSSSVNVYNYAVGDANPFEPAKGVAPGHAATIIADLVMDHAPGEVALAVTGPFTNLALAIDETGWKLGPMVLEPAAISSPADLNLDGIVDLADLAILISEWQ